MANDVRDLINQAIGCFDAAEAEGLTERLREQADTDVGSLHDLVIRRLLHAVGPLHDALSALPALPTDLAGLSELIDQYWDLAYAEGVEKRSTDTPSGDAQRIRTAIDATLEALAGRQVAVKPLEWKQPQGSETLRRADTTIGTYSYWTHHEAEGKWFWSFDGWVRLDGECDSADEAKAAAQADYKQRIRFALTAAPSAPQAAEEPTYAAVNANRVEIHNAQTRIRGLEDIGYGPWLFEDDTYSPTPPAEATPGERMIEGAKEAVAIARGEQPAPRIYFHGHAYVSEATIAAMQAEIERLKRELDEAHQDRDTWEQACRLDDDTLTRRLREARSRAEAAEASNKALREQIAEARRLLTECYVQCETYYDGVGNLHAPINPATANQIEAFLAKLEGCWS